MKHLHRLSVALWLSLALLVGQQAAALHALSHATDQVTHKQDSKPLSSSCDQCSAFSQLSGAVTASVPSVALIAGAVAILHVARSHGPTVSWLAFRSRAPPAVS